MSRLCLASLFLPLVVACGDDGPSTSVDAAVVDSSDVDAPPTGCDYVEQRDADNDDVPPATGTPEATNLTFSSRTVICGTIDHTHFDGDITVDGDGYTLAVASDTDVLVRLKAAGAEAIELVGVDIYTGASLNQLVGTLTFYGDHGVTSVRLPAGTYEFLVFALHAEAIAASVPYELAIETDTPALRCPELTSGGYAEANDGSNNDGNDVVQIPSGTAPSLTAATDDAPEPTGFTLSQTDQRISGTAANISAPDQYEDKDTYAISTSPMANELTVRLGWAGTATNLDFLLFEADNPAPVLRAIGTATQGPEARTFSIKPSTAYWLLIGAKVGGTVPMSYSASLCPARFTP